MATDFSRVRLNPLLDYAGVELKQGGVLLDADANELVDIARPPPARAGQRRARAAPRFHRRPPTPSRSPSAGPTLTDRQRPALCRRAACRKPWRAIRPNRPSAYSTTCSRSRNSPIRSTMRRSPICPALRQLPTDGRHLVYLDVWDREVTLSGAARPGGERRRRRCDVAHPDRLAGPRGGRRCRRQRHLRVARRRSAGLGRPDRAVDRRADHRHLRGCAGGRPLRTAADRRLSRPGEPALPGRNP